MSTTRSRTYTLCLHVFVLNVVFLCSCREVVRGAGSLNKGGIGDDLSDDLSDDQIREVVTKLNMIRSGVGASNMRKLQWSQKLGTIAAKLVNSCPLPSKLSTTLTPCAHVYGSYYVTNDVTVRLHDVIDRWKDQGVHYDFTDNVCSQTDECVEYRHLVWHTADRVGCSVKSCHIPAPDGTTVTPTRLFLCYFSPGCPTLDRPYLQGPPGSDCPPHLTIDQDGLCTGGPHISCPTEAASFSMSNTDGAVGGDLVTVDNTQMADKSLLKAINYIATNDDVPGDGETVPAPTSTHIAPLPAPLNGGTQNVAVMSSNMALPEWAAWLVVVAVGTTLLMVLAALFIEYKKRTLLLGDTLHPDFKKPRRYPHRQHRHNNHRRRRRHRANRILPRLERRPDLHLYRPARAFNNNHFRCHTRASPTGQLPHYTGARSDLYEEILSSRPRRPRVRDRRGSGSQRGLLNSPSGSPELGGRPRSGGRRFPSSTTSVGLWPPTGIPITNIGNGNYGNRENADNGNHGPNGNHGNGQNGNFDDNGHHGQYENHWGEADRYQNHGAPPPYHARPTWQQRYGSEHTINDFLIQDPSELL